MTIFPADLQNKIPTVCKFFENAISKNSLSHAYILGGSGSYSLKLELCKHLTKYLNCLSSDFKPCGKCTNCVWIQNDQHPEVPILLEADLNLSKKGVIVIDQVREFLKRLQNKSNFYRTIIIKKAEMDFLPSDSANAMLKTIEEPNDKILFFLFADDIDLVLPTIRSRCQFVNFPSIHNLKPLDEETQNLLKKIQSLNSFKDINQITDELTTKIDTKTLIDFLDNFLEDSLNDGSAWTKSKQNKISAIELAKGRLKAFCTPKSVILDMLISINQ
jgi:DNA polymerase III gamma/tau subunit